MKIESDDSVKLTMSRDEYNTIYYAFRRIIENEDSTYDLYSIGEVYDTMEYLG